MTNFKRFMELNRQANMIMAAAERLPKCMTGYRAAHAAFMQRHREVVELMQACTKAGADERLIKYTTKGDFTHLPACGLGFCRG